MVRHINYHAYHAKLLAIGFNGRATLKLKQCQKDSSKRNALPLFKSEHCCMWVGCSATFNAIQVLKCTLSIFGIKIYFEKFFFDEL